MSGHWEDSSSSYLETLKDSMTSPSSFFAGIRDKESIGRALAFALISLVIAGIAQTVWSVLFNLLGVGASMMGDSEGQQAAIFQGLVSSGMQIGIGVMTPVFGLISCFVMGGIAHLCLVLLGGSENGYMATVKAYLYATGPNVLVIIPCVGGMVAGIWSLIVLIIGIVELQKVSALKGAAAVLLIPMLCCCCVILLIFGGLAAAGVSIASIAQNMPH